MTPAAAPVAASPSESHRDFRLLWGAHSVAVLGSATSSVALPLLALHALDAGALVMGVLAAAGWLPWLVLGLPAGAWIDRGDNRRIMIRADLVAASGYATLPLAWALDLLTLAQLLVVALLTGGCAVFAQTASPGMVTTTVATHHLEGANARLVGTDSAMKVVGPGAAGLLTATISAAGVLGLSAVGHLASAVALARIRPTLGARRSAPGRQRSVGPQVREGMRVVAHDPYLRFFTVTGGLSNLGLVGYQTVLVLFLARDLGVSPAGTGLVLALGSTGGLLGALVARRTSRRLGSARALVVLQVLAGPPALLIPLASAGPGVALVPLGAGLTGLGVVAANVLRQTFRQRYTPPELLARTLGATSVVNIGAIPVAALAAGALGASLGLRPTIALMAAIHTAACLAALVGPYARRRDLPDGVMSATGRPA